MNDNVREMIISGDLTILKFAVSTYIAFFNNTFSTNSN